MAKSALRRAAARIGASLRRGSRFRAVRAAALCLASLLVLWVTFALLFGSRPHLNPQKAVLLALLLANLTLLLTLPDRLRGALQWANVALVGGSILGMMAMILRWQFLP